MLYIENIKYQPRAELKSSPGEQFKVFVGRDEGVKVPLFEIRFRN